MNKFLFYFLLMIIYSVLGWIMEIITVYFYRKKISNRGFLIGPYCPIYGTSATLMIILLARYKEDIITLFIMAFIICSVIEYLTSLFMEKIFKARWWDYSGRLLNVDGRVCLANSFAFGILGVLLLYFINPFIISIINKIPIPILSVVTIIILIVFITDCIISFKVVFNLNKATITLRKDYTDEINEIGRAHV